MTLGRCFAAGFVALLAGWGVAVAGGPVWAQAMTIQIIVAVILWAPR